MTDPIGTLRDGLHGTYTLERPIGEGGMATVYLAQDLKHQRPVALKVLKPELAQRLGPERFKREITTAARLQHPHILSVHDSGESQGHFWFTMPFVEGESLRDRLKREGRLPVEEAIRIARETAQALQYAHERGIVHRDIKPENLLLTGDGSTLVADFGIARALSADAAAAENLTQTGTSIGTPTYMAPEQATGDRTVDGRADQYSLAATLYEMLAGEPPFTATTAAALVAKRFTSQAPSVREKRPEVPAGVDLALQKALALRADDRFATVQEFARAVVGVQATPSSAQTVAVPAPAPLPAAPRRRGAVLVGIGLLAALGIGALVARRAGGPAAGTAGEATASRRLAVLPFENLGDTADAYFADGLSDELRGKLTGVPGLQVIARSSSVGYRGGTKSPRDIARELGVRYLLTGTVRWEKSGTATGRVRVSPELVEVTEDGTAESRWQQAFDAPITDVFTVQSNIAGQVVKALDVALGTSVTQALSERPTKDLEAYDAYLRAEAFVTADAPEDRRRAEELFERAVRRDSTFAKAWAGLARLRTLSYNTLASRPGVAEAARQALDRAMALAPDDPAVVLAQAEYERQIAGNTESARRLLEQALARSPNNADLLYALSGVVRGEGDFQTALARIAEALRLDPRNVRVNVRYAWTLLWLHDLSAARAAARHADSAQPLLTHTQTRVMVELAAGDLPTARAIIREGLGRYDRDELVTYFAVFNDLFWALEPAEERRVLQVTDDGHYDGRWSRQLTWAQIHHHLGDQAKARLYADSAQAGIAAHLQQAPDDAQAETLRGLALAYLGRRDEAIASGERGVRRATEHGIYDNTVYLEYQLARIHLELGEADKALDIIERILEQPYYVTPAWLRVDATLAPLRGNPRFEKLTAAR